MEPAPTFASQFSRHLICHICNELATDPIMLPCFDCFCAKCFQEYCWSNYRKAKTLQAKQHKEVKVNVIYYMHVSMYMNIIDLMLIMSLVLGTIIN